MQPVLSLVLFFLTSFLSCTVSASPYYSNTTDNAATLSHKSTSIISNAVGDYIRQGLGSGKSTSGPTMASLTTSTAGTGVRSSMSNVSYSTASASTFHGMSPGVFPSSRALPQSVQDAQRCWSQIMTWTTSSYSWYASTIANRAWPVVSTTSLDTDNVTWTTTIYPTNVTPYTLCDGSARVDAQPAISTLTSITTFGLYTHTSLVTPTFSPQPCEPSQLDCYVWYHNSNASTVNEDALLDLCGQPVHGNQPCVFAVKEAVELIYFPVKTVDGNLCAGNGSTISATPTISDKPNTVSTLGRVFTSGKVYLSIKSLYATQDGYPDLTVGTPLSDFIFTLESSAVSTQCSGTRVNTQLNYADLNWPVPASAYACQDRCGQFRFDISASPSWCNTIYQDVNPLIGIPTQVTDLDPAWKTCTLDPENLAGFWYDPPIALQEQQAAAQPTLPTARTTTPAAAASKPTAPAAATTQSASILPTQPSAVNSNSNDHGSSKPSQSTSASQVEQQDPTKADPTGSTPSVTKIVSSTFSFKYDPSSDPSQPSADGTLPTSADPGSVAVDQPSNSQLANAPAFSVLTEALSTFQEPSDPSSKASTSAAAPFAGSSLSHHPSETSGGSPNAPQITASSGSYAYNPATGPSSSGALFSLGSNTITALHTSDYYIIGSTTISVGQVATISNTPISAAPDGIVVGDTTAEISTLHDSESQSTTSQNSLLTTIIQAGSVLLTPTASASNIISFEGGREITKGGEAISLGDVTATYGSDGLVLISSGSTVPFTSLGAESTTKTNASVTSLPSVVFSTTATESRYWPTMTAVPTSSTSSGIRIDCCRWLLWFMACLLLYIII